MKVYIINDYEEHGPENIRVSLSIEGIRNAFHERLDADWPYDRSNSYNADYRIRACELFGKLIAANEPCSRTLGPGWGGLQLHIVEAIP